MKHVIVLYVISYIHIYTII